MEANQKDETAACSRVALQIDVINHSGVMSHVVGLFSRRQFNVEAVLCLPVGEGLSRIWLLVDEDQRVPPHRRYILQLLHLADHLRHAGGADAFARMHQLFLGEQEALIAQTSARLSASELASLNP
jgi:acetolactate synthase I/III small subunit